MPRRNNRRVFEPLDLTPDLAVPPPPPTAFVRRPGEQPRMPATPLMTRRERERKEREQHQRQTNARVNGGIDWSVCLVPGCGTNLLLWGSPQHREGWRDHTIALPLCLTHLSVAYEQAKYQQDDPLMIAAVGDVIERRQENAVTLEQAAKKAWLAKTTGHIYFIRINGLVKVGWSRDVRDRLHSYGPDVQVLVVYPATRDDETNLHRQLKPVRARGREWYEDGPIVADFVAQAIEEHGDPDAYDSWSKPKQIVAGKHHR